MCRPLQYYIDINHPISARGMVWDHCRGMEECYWANAFETGRYGEAVATKVSRLSMGVDRFSEEPAYPLQEDQADP